MIFQFQQDNRRLRFDTGNSVSIAITLEFDGPQPNHFGVNQATSVAYEIDGFVGDTRRGGGCNFDIVTLIPHCNGTHTECIGHIVDPRIRISDHLPDVWHVAVLITVGMTAASQTGEKYRPSLNESDRVITAQSLAESLASCQEIDVDALIVRTLPNAVSKRERKYGADDPPGFFTCEAIELIHQRGFKHLLVDLPSIDRMYDDGLLTNHHLYWNVKEGSHILDSESWTEKTITEMIYVPDDIPDGSYALNLQVAPFAGDAAPSRPVIVPIENE